MNKTKTCKKCFEEKNLYLFFKDKSRKDGLTIYCKECSKKSSKEIYLFMHPRKDNFCMDCKANITMLRYSKLRCKCCRDLLVSKRRPKDKIRQKIMEKIWRKKNRKSINARNRIYYKLKKQRES